MLPSLRSLVVTFSVGAIFIGAFLAVLMGFEVFIVVIWVGILLTVCLIVWWYLDLANREDLKPEEKKKWLFYVFNYPDTLWAFFRYLREKTSIRTKHKNTSETEE